MNNKEILKAQIISIIVCILLGTILHFTYELSQKNKFVGLFSAVNESTWEHLKLSFFPIIIVGILEYFFIGNYANNFIEAKAISSILSITIITILFYTYIGIFGKDNFIIDISIFIISIIISELISYKIMIAPSFSTNLTQVISIIVILIITILFGMFTFNPPKIKYFKDPITGEYGLRN